MYGELRKLGYDVHWQTVRRIMLDHGLLDDPNRPDKTSWKTFLQSHWESIVACNFLTVEAWTKAGLTRFLIHDRDPLFTARFRATLKAAGVRCLRMPKQSPNLNGYAESFVRNIKRECLNRMILFGEHHVRHVIDQYVEHYNTERPHKGLDYRRPMAPEGPLPCRNGPVLCHERLGGLLKSYCRSAA